MSERSRFKAYVTKYALTKCILEIDAEGCFDTAPDMIKDMEAGWSSYYHGKEWHLTRELAVARAEEMRLAKIASLKKQIAKLENLTFAGAARKP